MRDGSVVFDGSPEGLSEAAVREVYGMDYEQDDEPQQEEHPLQDAVIERVAENA